MNENKQTKRRLGALDWCLIIAAVLLIVGICFRLNVFRLFTPKQTPQLEEYLVTFRVANIRSTSGDLFEEGTVFYAESGKNVFGTVTGSVTITPAEIYTEDEDGKCVLLYYSGDGDDSRVDVSGVFRVAACISEDKGLYMLNGETYIAPNQSLTIYSDRLTVTVLITGITKN